MKKILVLPGGGALGLMQLSVLAEIEKQSGKLICEIFDLIVGTSVGAITGGILAAGIPATDLFDSFYDDMDVIFKKRLRIPFITPKYSRKNFDKVYNKLIFDDILMSDVETKFMCTSVNRIDKKTYFFKSWKNTKDTLRDCIKRSFAAPLYFGQFVDATTESIWFDGGVGTANLPLDMAFTESISLGWKSPEITCVTCGHVDMDPKTVKGRKKMFDKLKNQRNVAQVWDYVHADEGGLARIQSSAEKKYRFGVIDAKCKDVCSFRLIDTEIAEKYDKLDGIKYKNQYLMYGRHMANIIKENKWKW